MVAAGFSGLHALEAAACLFPQQLLRATVENHVAATVDKGLRAAQRPETETLRPPPPPPPPPPRVSSVTEHAQTGHDRPSCSQPRPPLVTALVFRLWEGRGGAIKGPEVGQLERTLCP